MGLDKWIKPEEEVKKKKPDKQVIIRAEPPVETSKVKEKAEDLTKKLKKQILTCPNSKCKYQKRIMKKQLTEKDKICPRCSSEMKIKSIK